MTAQLQSIISELKRFKADLPGLIGEEVLSHEVEVVAMNTTAQLYKAGVDSNGRKLSPQYTPFTIEKKKEKGQPYNRVTLWDTGDFHRSFKITPKAASIEISATDYKAGKLADKYGEAIFGLTNEHISATGAIILPGLIERLRNRLNIKQ